MTDPEYEPREFGINKVGDPGRFVENVFVFLLEFSDSADDIARFSPPVKSASSGIEFMDLLPSLSPLLLPRSSKDRIRGVVTSS